MAANSTVNVYGTQPISRIEKDITQQEKFVYGLSFPVGKKLDRGGFFKKISGVEAIKAAVIQLLKTERGERVMLPGFGCNLRPYLFQPLDEDTFESIKNQILSSFSKYIVGARVLKLSVVPYGDFGPAGGNSLLITLVLQLVEEDLTIFDVEVILK